MEISWKRVRRIFNDPRPPQIVSEKQFDYCDEILLRIASTPHEKINFNDLALYYDDLAYVELQPDLFNYLFPVCLMDWHDSLLADKMTKFHYSIHQGNVLEKMITSSQREAIFEFFRDSFLTRLDLERGFEDEHWKMPPSAWLTRFNSLGAIMPRIDILWDSWWSLETPGRAVAAVQYCSGLIYFNDENPLYNAWPTAWRAGPDGRPPYYWLNEFDFDPGWMPENVQHLQTTLTTQFVTDKLRAAIERLRGEPEFDLALRVKNDLPERIEILESRVRELPVILAAGDKGSSQWREWSV